ncbi:MAG: SIR2 family protein [Phycisphaeraceae bacterium]|nr:SIR2 family protein [Phycisphaeraceae bacterium]
MGQLLDIKQGVCEISSKLQQGNLIFFTGSAISQFHPSAIPTGRRLKAALISGLFDSLSDTRVKSLVKQRVGLRRISSLPFELAMERIHECLSTYFFSIFHFMNDRDCNSVHLALARLLRFTSSRTILTTNFDCLLESALKRLHNQPIVQHNELRKISNYKVFKLHGSIDDFSSISATLASVGRGMPRHISRRLSQLLSTHDICFIGYSGSDIDLMPFIKTCAKRRIFWLLQSKRELVHINDFIRELNPCYITGDLRSFVLKLQHTILKSRAVEQPKSSSLPYTQLHLSKWWKISVPLRMRLYVLALLYKQCAMWHQSGEVFAAIERSLPPIKSMKSRLMRASLYGKWADVEYRRRRLKAADNLWDRGLQSIKGVRGRTAQLFRGHLLNDMGAAYYKRGMFSDAQRYLLQAKDIGDSCSSKLYKDNIPELRGNNFDNLGLVAYATGSLDEAESHFQKAICEFTKSGNVVMKAVSTIGLVMVYTRQGRNEAIQQAENAWNIIEAFGTLEQRAVTACDRGWIYYYCGNIDQAILWFKCAITYAVKSREPLIATEASTQTISLTRQRFPFSNTERDFLRGIALKSRVNRQA